MLASVMGSMAVQEAPAAAAASMDSKGPPGIMTEFDCTGFHLSQLKSVGAGAHGVVYREREGLRVAKVSYRNTGAVIEAECAMLKRLEAANVPHVVRCDGLCSQGDRAVAVLSPYFPGGRQLTPVSFSSLRDAARRGLLADMAAFLVRCLAAGVAIADLQALIDSTGRVLFFDLTGAGPLDGPNGRALANTFTGDWCASLPVEAQELAAQALMEELEQVAPGTLAPAAAEALAGVPLVAVPESVSARLEASVMRAER